MEYSYNPEGRMCFSYNPEGRMCISYNPEGQMCLLTILRVECVLLTSLRVECVFRCDIFIVPSSIQSLDLLIMFTMYVNYRLWETLGNFQNKNKSVLVTCVGTTY